MALVAPLRKVTTVNNYDSHACAELKSLHGKCKGFIPPLAHQVKMCLKLSKSNYKN